MTVLRAVGMAFALYSRIPVPPLDWESGARRYTLYAFPLVGLAVGGGLLLWTWLAGALGLGQLLWAAGMTAIPLLITGGIHLDGFCDVCDALASHQSRERKLEIMADPHVGAFAVQGCGLLLLLTFGLWCQAERTDGGLWAALLLVPVLSRGLSAFAALTLPNARGDLYVQMGILRSLVNVKDLELLPEQDITGPSIPSSGGGKFSGKGRGTGSSNIKVSKSASISPEVNLIGMTVDEAMPVMEKYLDDAYLAHLTTVRVVHGRGTGALKNAVHTRLKKLKYVKEFRLGVFGEGDSGVTIVTFK